MKDTPRPTMTIPQWLELKKVVQRAAIKREIHLDIKPRPKRKDG